MAAVQEKFNADRFIELTARCNLKDADVDLGAYIEMWEEIRKILHFLSPHADFAWDDAKEILDVLILRHQNCTDKDAYATVRNMVTYESGPGPFSPSSIFIDVREGIYAISGLQNGLALFFAIADAVKDADPMGSDIKVILTNAFDKTMKEHTNWMVQATFQSAIQAFPAMGTLEFMKLIGIDINYLVDRGAAENIRTMHANIQAILDSEGFRG